MAPYKRRIVHVDAIQVTWENWNALCEAFPTRVEGMVGFLPDLRVLVYTGGETEAGGRYSQVAREGDWVVQAGDDLHVYPPEHFEAQFEPVRCMVSGCHDPVWQDSNKCSWHTGSGLTGAEIRKRNG